MVVEMQSSVRLPVGDAYGLDLSRVSSPMRDADIQEEPESPKVTGAMSREANIVENLEDDAGGKSRA